MVKIDVVNLRKNIDLLLNKRVDVLIHYEESMVPLLNSLNLADKVSKTRYQPTHRIYHHVAISGKSPLLKRSNEISEIIKSAVENGDFKRIRHEYYNQLN